jgi:putative addiction module component (TIGR02574 family)
MDSNTILNKALQLRPAERLQLIERLTRSLNKPDEKIEQIWAEESEKRYQAVKEGNVKAIPLNKIIKRYQ